MQLAIISPNSYPLAMQTTQRTLPLANLDRFWAAELGCHALDLRAGDLRLVPSGEPRIQVFATLDGAVVIGPPSVILIEPVQHAILDHLLDPEFWAAQLKVPLYSLAFYGPSSLSYVLRRYFKPQTHRAVGLLQRQDAAELARFSRILKAREPNIFHSWAIGGRETTHKKLWGATLNGKVVSVASIRPVHKQMYEVGVNTLPRHRQRGWGTTVASSATWGGLNMGKLVQWSAPLNNEPSIRIAKRLGYQSYAHQLWVGLPQRY